MEIGSDGSNVTAAVLQDAGHSAAASCHFFEQKHSNLWSTEYVQQGVAPALTAVSDGLGRRKSTFRDIIAIADRDKLYMQHVVKNTCTGYVAQTTIGRAVQCQTLRKFTPDLGVEKIESPPPSLYSDQNYQGRCICHLGNLFSFITIHLHMGSREDLSAYYKKISRKEHQS